MSTRTLLTRAQQAEWLDKNWIFSSLEHKWSTNGYGNSKILDTQGNVIGKAGGCGYDRYGTALGEAIIHMFPAELLKLAKRECKGKRRDRKKSEKFYGLFYDAVKGRAWVDGGCGSSCMVKILNKLGFSLKYAGESDRGRTGSQFYTLTPVTANDKRYL